jgi:hypothetical protein
VAERLLDLSRQSAYDAVSRGDLPALRIGRRLVIPVAKLRRLLGELPASEEADRSLVADEDDGSAGTRR